MHNEKTDILALFERECEGETNTQSDHTPRTEQTGEQEGASAAGEPQTISREEAFRALMEGEYKDLFTAYFQETFNRRFKEHKQIKEELQAARAVLGAVKERFGELSGEALLQAIRAEQNGKNAPTEEEKASPANRQVEAVPSDIEAACRRAQQILLDNIRARGLRPSENGLCAPCASVSVKVATTREERAEMARRAAGGEQIIL